MAERVIMPKQGLQMTEGTITKWLVKEGGPCKEGQPLFEMETDKLTITMDAPASGTLLKIVRSEGETVPITQTIAIIGMLGENVDALLREAAQDGFDSAALEGADAPSAAPASTTIVSEGRMFSTPRAKKTAAEKGIKIEDVCGTGPDSLVIERDVLAHDSAVKITPLAKKIVELTGTNVSGLTGTGVRGKIVKEDVEAASKQQKPAASGRIIPFTGMRKVIAERMTASLHTAAQATHRVKVDMSEVVRLREALKLAQKKISFNDIIIVAVCKALKQYPIMNSELTNEGILLKDAINIGIAVAIENGLIVPVIKNAGGMNLDEINSVARDLSEKAKTGRLSAVDYRGGSFTISNLGMFGLDEFVAIINPPEVGILAVGKIEKAPVVENDAIVMKPTMILTLTYDHRVVDGAPAAQFLMSIKGILENPYLLL